jgi:hypothetical protein
MNRGMLNPGCLRASFVHARHIVRLAAALMGAFAGPMPVRGDLIVLNRLSEIGFVQVGIGAPNDTIRSTDPDGVFFETLAGEASYEEPGGALNFGSWNIAQHSELSATRMDCDSSQTALTTTDFGSPGIYTRDRFELVFEVLRPTNIRLRGQVMGCSAINCDNFARVQLLRGPLNLFNTTFGQTFPFETTLDPGNTYTLSVELFGRAIFSGTTSSSAWIALIEITCAGDFDTDGDVDLADLAVVLANFGTASDVIEGDSDGDGDVDLDDLALLLANFGGACR